MTAVSNTPKNLNLLSNNNFLYRIERCPTVSYFAQNVILPSLMITHARENTPFATLPVPGDSISFDPLNVEFKVDEDLRNYMEIVDWMMAIGRPESGEKLEEYIQRNKHVHSHIDLFIMDQQQAVKYVFTFHDCLPSTLSQLSFTTSQTTTYQSARVGFVYSYYTYEKTFDYGEQEEAETE